MHQSLKPLLLAASLVPSFATVSACTTTDPVGMSPVAGSSNATGGRGGTGTVDGSSNGSGGRGGVGSLSDNLPGRGGPLGDVQRFAHPLGDAELGKTVFRFETFGNEGFWTRVLQLPQGLIEVSPMKLLQLGLSIDSERIPAALLASISAEVKTDLAPANAPLLNSAATTEALLEANAIIGLPAINVATLNGKLDMNMADVYAGESIGMSCALCHSVADGSVHKPASGARGGSIGKRLDAWGAHDLEFGKTIALGKASRAYYPTLALKLAGNAGKSVSRRGVGVNLIEADAPEDKVDGFLNDSVLYPIGMFDDETDGNGAPMHNTPFFRTELSAPWGSEGAIHFLQNFSNQVYTKLMEPTGITTEGGRKFMNDRGAAAGLEIVDNYEKILASLGVPKGGQNGYPFLARRTRLVNNVEVATGVRTNLSAGAKIEDSPLGLRVDEAKLVGMNGYLETVKPIRGDKSDPAAIARGRILFRTPIGTTSCTNCHRDDQSVFVPQNQVAYNPTVELYENVPKRPDLWTGYMGVLIAERTHSGLAPIRDMVGTFDDKLIISDPSNHDEPRSSALPLLVDLSRRPVFLHDDSVPSLDALLNPAVRLPTDPHPFFVPDAAQRADVVKFLRSLDDEPLR